MLEPGCHFFSCEVLHSLSANNSYQSYLARYADGRSVRLLVAATDHNQQGALAVAQQLIESKFNGLVVPLCADICDGQFTCAYPVCEGQTLADQIGQGGMPARSVLEILHPLVQLLIAPHSADLAHGNISPATIYLTVDGYCLDNYSLPQMFALDYQSGLDPVYTSPEQVRGEDVGVASDIYSLGCLLYLMLTGKPPFCGSDAFTVAMQHLQGNFPPLPAGHSCQSLLESMTCPDSGERSDSKTALALIEQLLNSETVDQVAPAGVVDDESVSSEQGDGQTFLSPEGEALDYTARIEARLKEYSAVMSVPSNDDISNDETGVPAAIEPLPRDGEIPFWRYFLILLAGILVGSGSYFLFFNRPADPVPVVDVMKDDISERLDQALIAWQDADVVVAIGHFREIAERYPDDPRASNNLAAIYAAQGDYEQARRSLEKALKTDLDYTTIYNNLAAVYAEMARDSYGKALQIDQVRKRLQLIALSGQGAVEVSTFVEQPGATKSAGLDNEQAFQLGSDRQELQSPADVVTRADTELSAVVDATISESETAPAVVHEDKRIPASEPGEMDVDARTVQAEEVAVSAQVESAKDFMQSWAQAWSTQNVEEYLACYDDNFVPPGGRTRSAWETQRETRISRPESIDVKLTDIQITVQMDAKVRYEAVQIYESDRYADRTRKVFDLHLNEDRWFIVRERSLGGVR